MSVSRNNSAPTHSEATHLWSFTFLQCFNNVDGILCGDVLIVVIRKSIHALGVISHSNHRSIHTGSHALHLAQRKHAVRGGLTIVLDTKMIAQGVLYLIHRKNKKGVSHKQQQRAWCSTERETYVYICQPIYLSYLWCTPDHARRCTANHKVVFSHLRPIKHGVESGDLVHTNGGDF